MSLWKKQLKSRLDGFKKLVIMGVGNQNRCDDRIGPAITEMISDFVSKEKFHDVRIFSCYGSPENFTGPVKKENPTHILLIDSCIRGEKPGTVFVLESEKIKNVDISSHRMPLKLLYEYLKVETSANIVILGVEPYLIKEGNILSEEATRAVREVVNFLKEFLKLHKANK